MSVGKDRQECWVMGLWYDYEVEKKLINIGQNKGKKEVW